MPACEALVSIVGMTGVRVGTVAGLAMRVQGRLDEGRGPCCTFSSMPMPAR